MKLRNLIAAIAAQGVIAMGVSACAGYGTAFDWSQAKKVQIGMSEAEITALMGKPTMVKTDKDQQVWVWSHADALGYRVVSFPMKDGRVSSLPNMTPF